MSMSFSWLGQRGDPEFIAEFAEWWSERFSAAWTPDTDLPTEYFSARLVRFHGGGEEHRQSPYSGHSTIDGMIATIREVDADSFEVEITDVEHVLKLTFSGFIAGGTGSLTATVDLPAELRNPNAPMVETVKFESERIEALKEFFGAYPPPVFAYPEPEFRVFLGHGHGSDWKIIQAAIEAAGYPVAAYESGAIAGETAIKIISDMIRESSAAVIYATPDDTMADGTKRARQNVIHEIGLAQGALGPLRTVIVQHSDVKMPSNLAGVNVVLHRPSGLGDVLDQITAYLEKAKSTPRP